MFRHWSTVEKCREMWKLSNDVEQCRTISSKIIAIQNQSIKMTQKGINEFNKKYVVPSHEYVLITHSPS